MGKDITIEKEKRGDAVHHLEKTSVIRELLNELLFTNIKKK